MRLDDIYLSDLCDTDNVIEHYGVKGMKWGVRRYQNKDGSLTAEGRKHVQNGSGEASGIKVVGNKISSAAGRVAKAVSKRSHEYRVKRAEKRAEEKVKRSEIRTNKKNDKTAKKNPLNMTDKELRKTIDRMKLEKEYRDLDREAHSGRTYIIETFKTVGQKVLTDPNIYVTALTGLYYLGQGKTAAIALEEQKTETAKAGSGNKKKNNN